MKILVCVKQTPDPDVELTLRETGAVEPVRDDYVMNRLDEYAMEAALVLVEEMGGGSIDAVTVGPARTESALRRALAMGAGQGIHILTEDGPELTGYETASLIARAAGSRGYDLIAAGVMSSDAMAGAVGPMTAGLLDLAWATSVVAVKPPNAGGALPVLREGEGGALENLELGLPALVTIQSGAHSPRYPNLTNMLRANKQELEVLDARTLDAGPANEIVRGVFSPPQRGSGVFLDGAAADKARKLHELLKERALL